MLLRSKKTQGEEQNWCVILSPIKNEFDKKKIAQKISEVFSLSVEEAMDLVSNTPIILLDNLSRNTASKVQDYFRGVGADIVLTNDVLQKRKCYRTVWPETPNLSFLHQWQHPETHPGHPAAETLPADEALDVLRSIEPPISITSKSSNLKFSDFSEPENMRACNHPEEIENLHKEISALREQSERYRDELNQQKERAARLTETQGTLGEKEKELKELRMLLTHAEEKYQVLHEEYREARSLYEEKIALLAREVEQWKAKGQDGIKLLQGLQSEKQTLLDGIKQKEILLEKAREEQEKTVRTYEQKINIAVQEIDSLKLRTKELTDKLTFLQRNKEQLEASVNEQADKISHLSDKQRQLLEAQDALRRQKDEEILAREASEKRGRELLGKQQELLDELEARRAEIKHWELKAAETEKQFQELQEAYQNQDHILQANLRQLEHREKELESARKQLREINFQIEQREATQRRTRLSQELVEKEVLLKKLVGEQEKMESEIREREESIRKVLLEQEKVEKEIMEGKQAQRHLAELAKRERGPRFKNGKEAEDGEAAGQE